MLGRQKTRPSRDKSGKTKAHQHDSLKKNPPGYRSGVPRAYGVTNRGLLGLAGGSRSLLFVAVKNLTEKGVLAQGQPAIKVVSRDIVRAETKGQFLPGVVFAKGCELLVVSLRNGFGVGFRGVGGGWFSSEK